jgi:hypothetical protein
MSLAAAGRRLELAASALPAPDISERIAAIDWQSVVANLDADGYAVIDALLSHQECTALAESYQSESLFRSTVVMARHGFGRGEYKYFCSPLPQLVASLRAALYPRLCGIANRWNTAMNLPVRYPQDHEEFLERCHRAGQTRPTPLLLRYAKGDFNCLHQDLYGEHVFPLQAAILLSKPAQDFSGGEFLLTEQRPRMQPRATVVPLEQGSAAIFAVNNRPVQGTRGTFRVKLRHGVSPVRAGQRHTLGIIFHDAQ